MHKTSVFTLQCFIIIFNENSLPHGVPPSFLIRVPKGVMEQKYSKLYTRDSQNSDLILGT